VGRLRALRPLRPRPRHGPAARQDAQRQVVRPRRHRGVDGRRHPAVGVGDAVHHGAVPGGADTGAVCEAHAARAGDPAAGLHLLLRLAGGVLLLPGDGRMGGWMDGWMDGGALVLLWVAVGCGESGVVVVVMRCRVLLCGYLKSLPKPSNLQNILKPGPHPRSSAPPHPGAAQARPPLPRGQVLQLCGAALRGAAGRERRGAARRDDEAVQQVQEGRVSCVGWVGGRSRLVGFWGGGVPGSWVLGNYSVEMQQQQQQRQQQ